MKLAALGVLVLALAQPAATAAGAGKPTIDISPIHALFQPQARATLYSISRFHLNGRPEPVSVTWTLKLQLVDPAGAADPATPGSGAGVDLGCTNAGVGVAQPQHEVVAPGHATPRFVWHHPDPPDSVPPGKYHCDHGDMGPHGHQGLIRVVVADKHWSCTATYKGTDSSTKQSVANGTATEPKCRPL